MSTRPHWTIGTRETSWLPVGGYSGLTPGRMYYIDPAGTGSYTAAGQFSSTYRRSHLVGGDVSPGMDPAVRRQFRGCYRDRHPRHCAPGDADTNDVDAAPMGVRHGACRRSRARTGGSAVVNQLTGSTTARKSGTPPRGDGPSERAAAVRVFTIPAHCCCRTRACWSTAAGRPVPDESTRGNLLSAAPL